MKLVISILTVLLLSGRGYLQCNIASCDPSDCNFDQNYRRWQCEKCEDNFYLHSNRCYSCKQTCSKCTSSTQCSECKPYYYGSRCQSNCTGCSGGLCDKSTGACESVCIESYYKGKDNLCKKCSLTCAACGSLDHCTHCVNGAFLYVDRSGNSNCYACRPNCYSCNNYNTCTLCKQHYWGTYCQNNCENCITACDKNSGCSAGCNNGYYRYNNTSKGGYECYQCPSSCLSCSSISYCQECIKGFWGSKCEKSCPFSCDSCTNNLVCNACKSGYWGSVCQNNCGACYNNICTKTQGCMSGCRDKYYMNMHGSEMHCKPCQSACKTCDDGISCSSCSTGFNGTLCEYDCRSCAGQLCNWNTGRCSFECRTNQYFDTTQGNCQQCPNGCARCTSHTSCHNCLLGRWGRICGNNCNENCKHNVCDKSNGKCLNGCTDGFYGDDCSSSCLPGCQTCRYGYLCSTCKDGHFNSSDNFKCDCREEHCTLYEKDKCTECSKTEWYPHLSGCCQCSNSCENNACFSNKTCIKCSSDKYGDQCEHRCSSNCRERICYRDGTCISCPDNRYGPLCRSYCSFAIYGCTKCYSEDANPAMCTRCQPGRYVENNRCIQCHHCRTVSWPQSKCNTTTGTCVAGCKEGFYGDKCDSVCNVTNCLLCPTNPNVCQTCKDGFYTETNSVCTKCPAYCKLKRHCNKFNGSCTSGCIAGWSGELCNRLCLTGCKSCNQFNSSLCDECLIGFYGSQCEKNCNLNCETKDVNQVCNKSNGFCEHGCRYGFWGHACEKDCGTGCDGSVCNIISGSCINGCTHKYHGAICQMQCSKHCLSRNNDTVSRSCHNETGDCLLGCAHGWFGGLCENECSKQCNGTMCDRQNGTCTFGCNEGYLGSNCSQAIVSDSEVAANVEAIGAGAGAGVALLLAVVVIMGVLFWRRRRMSSKPDANDSGTDHVSPDYRQTDQSLVYSNIDDTGIGTEDSSKSGVSNMLYANVRMSDLSKGEQANTTYELAMPVSEDFLKEEEIIDGELAAESESNTGEVDDTYYNVTGKRVAVENLPEYIRNRSRGDIYADFQRIPKGLLKDHKEARRAKNIHKNKYRSIYPYDESRVILHDGGSDYMNASYIEGYNSKRTYIASSGPFKKSYDTTPDFWRMIWQEKCENIVMLTNPVENEETKCIKYWPEPDGSNNFGKIQVTTLTEDRYSDFTIRIFTVTKGDESFNVRHLHFTAWPDKGVPHDVTSMIEFRQKVKSLHKHKNCPLLVHCSAGIGRTGTFIALDMLTFEGEDKGSVDIFGCVAALRSQRCNMVQTKEQYDYLHHAVLHSLTFDCRRIADDMFLQNYNKLIERNGGKRIIDLQFQHLQSTTDEMIDEDKVDVLRNQSLTNKNREGADIPVDEYRVKLRENRKPGAVDYINAVWINGFRTRHKFIVAQTPLPSTVVDFLTLVHQEKCSCIVMMEEADISHKSVGVYWPADNQSIKHGVFKISCKDSTSTRHYAKKTLSITCHSSKGEDIHDVHLFIFTNWPKGNAVPKASDSVLQLVKAVDTVNRSKDKESTILVHCLTGSERSCVYCAVSVLIEKMEIEHEVSVVNTLGQIKARRRSAFSSLDQYKFCHQAVISYLQSFDTYSNFGLRDSEASSV